MADPDLDVAKSAWAALGRVDLDAFLEVIDPDIEFHSLVAEAEGRTYRGYDGVREWWGTVRSALGGLRFDVEDFTALDDGLVLTRLVSTGTVADVEVGQMMWNLSQIRDGKAIWWSVFRSEEEALEAARSRVAGG
jgi:ketosteroid isomerase-like protein